MRISLSLPLALAVALLPGCDGDKPTRKPTVAPTTTAKPELLLRLHFAGGAQLAATTNAAKLNEITALPASAKLREQVFQKLSRELPRRVLVGTNATSPEQAALLRPLLDDIASAELQLEVAERRGLTPAWSLTVKLDDVRASLWQTNLGRLLAISPATKASAPFSVIRRDKWLVVAQGIAGTVPAAISNVWLEGEANLAKLAPLLRFATNVPWPRVEFTMSSKGDLTRTEARLRFAEPQQFALGPWRVPTNSIRDELVSFTAAQGFADWLGRQPLIKQINVKPLANQFFAWSRTDIPYQTFAALPAPGAARVAGHLGVTAPALLNSNLQQKAWGKLLYVTERNELVWQGLPLLLPFVRSAPEAGADFLLAGTMAGLVPKGANTNPPPAELFAQFQRTNVVYYDWEITELRLQQCRQIAQLITMLKPQMIAFPPPAGGAWLDAVGPRLGNTITEVTSLSATELRLVRSSHIGLTGIELVLLARWLDNPAFPSLQYPEPPPMPGAPPVPK